MSMSPWSVLLAGAVLVAGCAGSGKPDAAPAAAAATLADAGQTEMAADDPDRMVCKNVQKTGTRFGTRHCFTQRRWDEMERRSQETHADIQLRASHNSQDSTGTN